MCKRKIWKGETMDDEKEFYKEMIVEMIKKLNDREKLRNVYVFLKALTK